MCFFGCQEQLAGKAYHEGVDVNGQDVAIAVCPNCVGFLGALLADATCELEAGMSRTGFLRQALAKVEAAAWEALALQLDGGREAEKLLAAV
jgi:hypothetical protein